MERNHRIFRHAKRIPVKWGKSTKLYVFCCLRAFILCLSSFCSFFNVCVCVCLPVSNINMAILTCLCSHVVCGHCRFRFDVFIPRISHSRLSQLVWFANLTCSDTKHKKSHHTCPRCWARTDSDFLCLLFLTYSITLLLTINGAFGDKKNNKKGP